MSCGINITNLMPYDKYKIMGAHHSKRHVTPEIEEISSEFISGTFFDVNVRQSKIEKETPDHLGVNPNTPSPKFVRPRAKTISQAYPSLAFWRMRHDSTPPEESLKSPVDDKINYYSGHGVHSDKNYYDYFPNFKKINKSGRNYLPTVFRWDPKNTGQLTPTYLTGQPSINTSIDSGISSAKEPHKRVEFDIREEFSTPLTSNLDNEQSNQSTNSDDTSQNSSSTVITGKNNTRSRHNSTSSDSKSPKDHGAARHFIFPQIRFKSLRDRMHHHHTNSGGFSGGSKPKVWLLGSWDGWKSRIPMVLSDEQFSTIVEIPEGKHEYKFLVDDNWAYDERMPVIENAFGSKNNVIEVKKSDFEVFDALADDLASTSAGHDSSGRSSDSSSGSNQYIPHSHLNYLDDKGYSQDIPSTRLLIDWDRLFGSSHDNTSHTEHSRSCGERSRNSGPSGPPILPPQLLQVILNQNIPYHFEPELLPEPNHVMVNHLYALSIKDNVMVLSCTHRHNKKYVTTLLYKPVE